MELKKWSPRPCVEHGKLWNEQQVRVYIEGMSSTELCELTYKMYLDEVRPHRNPAGHSVDHDYWLKHKPDILIQWLFSHYEWIDAQQYLILRKSVKS